MSLAKLLTNCAGASLLTDCTGNYLLKNCPKMKIRFTWTGAAGYWTQTAAAYYTYPVAGYYTYTGGAWVWTPEVAGFWTPAVWVYTPARGWDLFSEVTFLGTSLGWIDNGLGPTAYLTWFVNETHNVGGYEEYTVNVEKSHEDGAWGPAPATILLEADWYSTAGISLTVAVAYNGITRTLTISPGSLKVIPTFVHGPSPIVTRVGLITIDSDGNFTLVP